MVLTIGALNVHYILQKIVPPPYLIDPVTQFVSQNLHCYSPQRKLFQKFLSSSLISHLIFSAVWFTWLIFGKRSAADGNLQEKYCYLMILSLCTIATSAFITLEKHQNHIRFQLNQRFSIAQLRHQNSKSAQEIFIYIFSTIFGSFPVLTFFFPYGSDLHPFQVVFAPIIDSPTASFHIIYAIKGLASLVYGSTTVYGAGLFLSIMLFTIMDMEGMNQFSSRMGFPTSTVNFGKCLRNFRITQILIGRHNYIMSDFMSHLVFMGVVLAVGCGFGTITLYGSMPITVYASYPCIVVICFGYNSLYFTLTARPRRNGQRFVAKWKEFGFGKRIRLSLKACPEIGYSVGSMRCVTEQTALAIADCIVNWTASFAMI